MKLLSADDPISHRLFPPLLLEPDSDEFNRNPGPTYKLLRLINPIAYWPQGEAWLLTRHTDVINLLTDERFSPRLKDWGKYQSSPRDDLVWRSFESEDLHALGIDDVKRLRGLLDSYFSGKHQCVVSSVVEQVCSQKLFRIRNTQSFDLIEDFARDISIRVIVRLFGIPEQYLPLFIQFASAYVDLLSPGMSYQHSELQQRMDRLLIGRVLIQDAIRSRRGLAKKGAFPIDHLVEMRHSGYLVSDAELVSLISILAVGGLDMSRLLIANTVLNVLREGVLPLLRADESLWGNTVREVARYDFPLKLGSPRYALEDCQLGSALIRKGDVVYPVIAAAQRDPAVFERPDDFDIYRDTSKVVTYDLGSHPFVGLDLALLEAQISARCLFQAAPKLIALNAPIYDRLHRTLRSISAYTLAIDSQIKDSI